MVQLGALDRGGRTGLEAFLLQHCTSGELYLQHVTPHLKID